MTYRILKAYENIGFLKSASARPIRILAEYFEPLSRFEKKGVDGTVVLYGSSRIRPGNVIKKQKQELKKKLDTSPHDEDLRFAWNVLTHREKFAHYYDDAMKIAQKMTEWASRQPEGRRFLICTGGGPGIMEAGNRGATSAGGPSIGLGISIPVQEVMNEYVPSSYQFLFHYFFMRKFWFMYLAKAVIFFPGGFGTFDELFEVLTLLQTRKVTIDIPIVLYDESYWREVIHWDKLVEYGMIEKEHLSLFVFLHSPDEVVDYLISTLESLYPVKKNREE